MHTDTWGGPVVQTSWRAAALGGIATVAAGGLAWATGRAAWSGTSRLGTGSVAVADGVLVLVAGLTAVVALGGALAALLGAVAVLPHGVGSAPRRAVLRRAPRWAGRSATVLLALSLASPAAAVPGAPAERTVATAERTVATAVGPVASAAPEESSGATPRGEAAVEVPLPGWTPPAERLSADAGLVAAGGSPLDADRTVVVHRGDTLWAIAARHLGPGATAEEVAQAWPRWHESNRSVIGDDPDLLLPGQQLTPPPPHPEGSHR
jgi:nucleoid-associated protein YgaU